MKRYLGYKHHLTRCFVCRRMIWPWQTLLTSPNRNPSHVACYPRVGDLELREWAKGGGIR